MLGHENPDYLVEKWRRDVDAKMDVAQPQRSEQAFNAKCEHGGLDRIMRETTADYNEGRASEIPPYSAASNGKHQEGTSMSLELQKSNAALLRELRDDLRFLREERNKMLRDLHDLREIRIPLMEKRVARLERVAK